MITINTIIGFLTSAWQTLASYWSIKVCLSCINGIAIWLIGIRHIQILGVFILLVFLDLVTKWGAIAYQMLIDEYGYSGNDIAVWEKYRAIPLAFDHKLIKSEYMRKGFVQKILTYVLATAAAYLFDCMSSGHAFAVNLVWLYLGSAEFLSVLENLRDGGNASMGKFLALVQTKVESKVKGA